MKFLIIGNVGFDVMAPYLDSRGIESILVMTTLNPLNAEYAGAAYHFLSPTDPDPLIHLALEHRVDAVISISGPDIVNVRDSLIRESLERLGITVVANPPQAARIAADKWETKKFLKAHGLPAIEGEVAANRREALSIGRRIGFPLAAKAVSESGGLGFRVLQDSADLSGLPREAFPVLLEEYTPGWEFSVEVLHWKGQALPLLPVYKGHTSLSGLHPMERVKIAPAPIPPDRLAMLRCLAVRTVRELGAEPTADVDIVWSAEGPKVLEINPRFGGVTALSMAASGVTCYHALVDMALGSWSPHAYPFDIHYALDLPVADELEDGTLARLLGAPGVFRIKKQKLTQTTGRIAVKARSSQEALTIARKVAKNCDLAQDFSEIERSITELIPV